jgi:dienelactone hydrolase
MSKIHIPKGSLKLAGLLFKPSSLSGKAPGVVVIHTGGGVKEQSASIYAKKLSDKGYIAIAYDAAHQGES